jgi:peptidoglycan/xylan/chitin deacetylase (PgdA/CDA1 family)
MRRITVVTAASAAVVALALGGFAAARIMKSPSSAATTVESKVADADLATGTISTTGAPATAAPEPLPTAPAAAAASPGRAATLAAVGSAPGSTTALGSDPSSSCVGKPDALGVSRVVEIDTKGGPGFGSEQFKAYDFLEPGEVVLTFDDGPWPGNTPAVLAALAAQCVKATFFNIGKHATWHPEILKQVLAQGHTVGAHTWSHADLAKKSFADAKEEIERGFSAVAVSAGQPISPFFRFPALRQTPELLAYLSERNIGVFSADLDSFDFKLKAPEQVIASVMTKLKKRGKGIILMHDFQHGTAMALPELLAQLKANGFKVVHLTAKDKATTLPQYDAEMVKAQAGQTSDARPTTSVVRTISTYMSERPRP